MESPKQNSKTEKNSVQKNIIIGSSVVKGIKTRGLHNCDVLTNRGAHIPHITDIVMTKDLSNYKNIIVQVGGNDIAHHGNIQTFLEDYESLLYALRAYGNKDSNIIVSGLLPRSDVSVYEANHELMNLCKFLDVIFIDQLQSFRGYQDYPNSFYFGYDGIHLNRKGTSMLLRNMNTVIGILKRQPFCDKCGEQNHTTNTCRFENRLKCFKCNHYGHKIKNCTF